MLSSVVMSGCLIQPCLSVPVSSNPSVLTQVCVLHFLKAVPHVGVELGLNVGVPYTIEAKVCEHNSCSLCPCWTSRLRLVPPFLLK